MKGALVAYIAKVEGMVREKFSRALPQTQKLLAPPIKFLVVPVIFTFTSVLNAKSKQLSGVPEKR